MIETRQSPGRSASTCSMIARTSDCIFGSPACSISTETYTPLIRKRDVLQVIVEDKQTTARGRPGRACGNSVLPKRRLAGFLDQILFLSDESRGRQHP